MNIGKAHCTFRRFALLTVVLFASAIGCSSNESKPRNGEDVASDSSIKRMVGSELLILDLTKELKHLNRDIKNLSAPGSYSKELWADQVVSNRVQFSSIETATDIAGASFLKVEPETSSAAREEFKLWPSLFEMIEYFSHAKVYFVDGAFASDERREFVTNMGFEAVARLQNKSWLALKGKMQVSWIRQPDSDAESRDSWKIAKMISREFLARQTNELLFDECLEEYCGKGQAEKLRFSQHFAYMSELVGTGSIKIERKYGKYFSPGQTLQHAGVCSVDINNDGWDDIYVCDEWMPNKLLINDNGNRFYEAAEKYGLDVALPSTSAIFADFDNDGDQDAFVGRCYDKSLLLINEDGYFVDKTSSHLLVELPYLVTSVAANDFNNDGLIDIYISTYGYASGNRRFKDWADDFLTPTDHERYLRMLETQHRFLSAFGPSNLLLQNIGGNRFAAAVENKYIDHNHNTFQSVWVDYDQDGDQDLYVSNDYAQDFLYRNDRGTFTDVTFEVGGKDMLGFGMGAGWGDYDADGDFDLYVSNMYSKAGNRILKQVPGIDSRFNLTANGNRLYQQNNGKLNCLPGTNEHAVNAGWSWGGKFSDFDNDGLLDVYVSSGYLTSPFDDEQIEDL